MKRTRVKKETKQFSAAVGRALRRAAKVARKTARMHGTPIYIWKDAKSSLKNPDRLTVALSGSPMGKLCIRIFS